MAKQTQTQITKTFSEQLTEALGSVLAVVDNAMTTLTTDARNIESRIIAEREKLRKNLQEQDTIRTTLDHFVDAVADKHNAVVDSADRTAFAVEVLDELNEENYQSIIAEDDIDEVGEDDIDDIDEE